MTGPRRPPMPEREALERVLAMVLRDLEELRFMERFLLKRLGRAPPPPSPAPALPKENDPP